MSNLTQLKVGSEVLMLDAASISKIEVKRLQPKGNTLRELFLKSGNLCAFPGCLMMDPEGNFIGEVCHIEAAEPPVRGSTLRKATSNVALSIISYSCATSITL